VSRSCVLLFARPPALEAQAKGMGRARRVFDLSRRRVLEAAAALPGVDLVVVGSGSSPITAPPICLPQRGRSFGERLRHAFQDVRTLGYDRIVAVPIDCPGLRVDHLAAAFIHLEAGRSVLGPSPDGGVYLLGAPGDPASWLERVSWGTPLVFRQLLAAQPGSALLPPLADVDTPSDLGPILRDPGLPAEIASEIRRLLLPVRPSSPIARTRLRRPDRTPLACRPPPLAA